MIVIKNCSKKTIILKITGWSLLKWIAKIYDTDLQLTIGWTIFSISGI